MKNYSKSFRDLGRDWFVLYTVFGIIVFVVEGFFSFFFFTFFAIIPLRYLLRGQPVLLANSLFTSILIVLVGIGIGLWIIRFPEPKGVTGVELVAEKDYRRLRQLYQTDWLNEKDPHGSTVLKTAVVRNYYQAALQMLRMGADPTLTWPDPTEREQFLQRFATREVQELISDHIERGDIER